MKPHRRKYPAFALCGLNCGLCPRYHTDGPSRCPGCGGPDFHLKHPSCGVISCGQRHGGVEFCFQCDEYPCARYEKIGKQDSFISYRNVVADMKKAVKSGIASYTAELKKKMKILETLIRDYNDGKSKLFYCQAVNLLDLPCLQGIMSEARKETGPGKRIDQETALRVRMLFENTAKKKKIDLKLRK